MVRKDLIVKGLQDVMNSLCIDRMPTRAEMETIKKGLYSRIQRSGGIIKWANELDLPLKTHHSIPLEVRVDKDKNEFIQDNIFATMNKLNITRMPSFSEMRQTLDDSDQVLNLIRRNGGYQGSQYVYQAPVRFISQ